jgi:hypothetical protein
MPDQGQVKRPIVRRLPFGTSPAKQHSVNIQPQGKVRKPRYDPMSAMNLRKVTMARHNQLRADYATCVRHDKYRAEYAVHLDAEDCDVTVLPFIEC